MENSEMPLTEHLSELRKRILISLTNLFVIFILVFNFSEKIFGVLTFPLKSEYKFSITNPYFQLIKKPATQLIFLAPAEAFWMHLKVSLVASFICALPVIFYQFWQFIAPGLLSKEKKYILPFIITATILFLVGALFCFFVVLPFAMTFLLGYKTENITPMLSVEKYIDFCLKFILAFGGVFELPLIIIFLTRFGIVSPQVLAKNRKYAVLFSFILGAILTPTPDAFNQSLMAVPIIVLYEVGIILSRFIYRKKK